MAALARRDLLARLGMWLAAVPTAGVAAWIGVRFLAAGRGQRVVTVVGAGVADLPPRAALTVENIAGHRLILRRDRDGVAAFSTVCPHMGCAVAWEEAAREFVCPCHAARFAADGAPLAGPVDRPLRRLPAVIRGELVYVELPVGETP
ncbi:MAG TPA: Rieske 2Fe-2S domain-containing protein [Polyangia bacterium]|jgi:cytochrome b6-f complex iron-sulfur subunit